MQLLCEGDGLIIPILQKKTGTEQLKDLNMVQPLTPRGSFGLGQSARDPILWHAVLGCPVLMNA